MYSRTSRKRHPKCQTQVVVYRRLKIFSLSANGNFQTIQVVCLMSDIVPVQCVRLHFFFTFFECFIHLKNQFRLKNPILPIKKILFLLLRRKAIMLQHLIIQFSFYYLSSGILRKSIYERHSLALKVVAVAYERWSLTTGSRYSDQT